MIQILLAILLYNYDNKKIMKTKGITILCLIVLNADFSIGKQSIEEKKDKEKYRDCGRILFSKSELKIRVRSLKF